MFVLLWWKSLIINFIYLLNLNSTTKRRKVKLWWWKWWRKRRKMIYILKSTYNELVMAMKISRTLNVHKLIHSYWLWRQLESWNIKIYNINNNNNNITHLKHTKSHEYKWTRAFQTNRTSADELWMTYEKYRKENLIKDDF
jgi:hypothetical protein